MLAPAVGPTGGEVRVKEQKGRVEKPAPPCPPSTSLLEPGSPSSLAPHTVHQGPGPHAAVLVCGLGRDSAGGYLSAGPVKRNALD